MGYKKVIPNNCLYFLINSIIFSELTNKMFLISKVLSLHFIRKLSQFFGKYSSKSTVPCPILNVAGVSVGVFGWLPGDRPKPCTKHPDLQETCYTMS